MTSVAALAPALLAAAAAGTAWQATDALRLRAQAEAAWQDLEVAQRHGAPDAVTAAQRYYTDVTRRYHRRLRQPPVRWLARWLGCAPRAVVLEVEPAPRPPGPWGP